MYIERNQVPQNEIAPEHILFEGVTIERGKREWLFEHETLGSVAIDTYSIWDPQNWQIVAKRLTQGEICAMYVAGTYGVGEIAESPQWQEQGTEHESNSGLNSRVDTSGHQVPDVAQVDETLPDEAQKGSVILEEIKKRPAHLNLVSFMAPEDQIDVIDTDRLPQVFRNHRWAKTRGNSYAWAEHHVYPLRRNGTVNPHLIRKDNASISCFWINGHFGYQGIVDDIRRLRKHGNFGGGSLNIHGMEPSYSKHQLISALRDNVNWLRRIKFVIFDEIAEGAQIGRSQPMISFCEYPPKLVREGSLSATKIQELTGINPQKDQHTTQASSTTPYDNFNNTIIDGRVLSVKSQIRRYWYYLKENGLI